MKVYVCLPIKIDISTKMLGEIPSDVFKLITTYAWCVPLKQDVLNMQLDCAIDCRANIPDWFKRMGTTQIDYYGNTKIYRRNKNPLIDGHPFIPLTTADMIYDENVFILLKHINKDFWRRNRWYRKTVWNLATTNIVKSWNFFIERMQHLTIEDITVHNGLLKTLLHTMVLSLPHSGLICRWPV